jgi:hypothetical protein
MTTQPTKEQIEAALAYFKRQKWDWTCDKTEPYYDAVVYALQSALDAQWQPIETAPRDERVLVKTEQDIYVAHWVKNPFTDDEAWLIATFGDDGDQLLVKPHEWMPLPAAHVPAKEG